MRLHFRHAAKSVRSERQLRPVFQPCAAGPFAEGASRPDRGRQELELWGTGAPRREFLYVDDLTDALVYVMKTYSEEKTLNVGAGYDVTIAELAQTIMRVVGLAAQLRFDVSKPDGTPQKLMDSGRLQKIGWKPTASLEEGVRKLYASFLQTELAVS
jgi:GDP-L-fucose synthase